MIYCHLFCGSTMTFTKNDLFISEWYNAGIRFISDIEDKNGQIYGGPEGPKRKQILKTKSNYKNEIKLQKRNQIPKTK